MAKTTGATALMALDAAALDLETTSLDASEARIVQIGALRMNRGKIDTKSVMDKIVDPGIPIPSASTAVHGINNAMLRTAPDIRKAWQGLLEFIKNRVLIGHTIAYDLTILAAEAQRHGLPWQKPRSLCIRHLAPLALPDLHDPSLDKLAAWFGIRVEHRHSALSDAQAAGEIFLKLVPLLQERGIRTLAEAERAILMRSMAGLRQGQEAGWERPVVDPSDTVLSGGIKNYDTYAYRHAVGDMMAKNPVVVAPQTSLLEATKTMTAKGISSVLVAEKTQPGQPLSDYGIVTERDVMRQIAQSGAEALKKKAGTVAVRPLASIRENAFVYRAMSRMRRLKYRHLAVVDEEQKLVGMISARDLLKLRSDAAIALDDAIGEAENAADLANAWGTLPAVVNSLIQENLDSHKITRIVSEEIRSMTERATILAELDMKTGGYGDAPCPYAVIVLGSGGRGESLLKPDQDNAIIFEKGDPGGPEDKWFAELGNRMAAILDAAGIPFCDGGIMAKNAEWRGSVGLWESRLEEWVSHTNPQNLLNVDIFFDQAAVYGRRELSIRLFRKAYEAGSQNVGFAKALGANVESVASPFNMFGRIRGENNRLDLKLHALFPLVAGTRALAIRHNTAVHSTQNRLAGLLALDKGDVGLLGRLREHHAFLLGLMLQSQEREIGSGRKPTNFIDLGQLDRNQTARLKDALSDIQYIPNLVRDMMF